MNLERQKPLRAKVGLSRGKPLARTGFLRRQSSKARATSKARRKIADELEAGADGGVVPCEAKVGTVCRGYADDLHEPLTRARGGDPTDRANVLPVCRPCHSYIHENPGWAQSVGLLRSGTAPDENLTGDTDSRVGEVPGMNVGDRAGLSARTFLGGGAPGRRPTDHDMKGT